MTTELVGRTFSAMGDETRLEILRSLARGPQPVNGLVRPFDVSRPAISRHLRVLREAGLVRVEQLGRERVYSLDGERIAEAEVWLRDLREFWSDTLRAFKDYVEGESDA